MLKEYSENSLNLFSEFLEKPSKEYLQEPLKKLLKKKNHGGLYVRIDGSLTGDIGEM